MNIVSLLFGFIILYIPLNSFYLQIIPPFPSRFFCGQSLPSPHSLPPLLNADGNQKKTIKFNLLQLGNWKLPHHQNISLALVYANYLRVYGGKEDCKKIPWLLQDKLPGSGLNRVQGLALLFYVPKLHKDNGLSMEKVGLKSPSAGWSFLHVG